MDKKLVLIALAMLVIGVCFGVAGYALATASSSPGSMFSNLWKGDSDSLDGTAQVINAPADEAVDPSSGTSEDETQDPTSDSTADTTEDAEDAALKEKIISDYKLNIGTFFTAWKSKDMAEFRDTLSKAYTGELLEKHVRRAQPFIEQGVGIQALDITFDSIDIISADDNAATLIAEYHYLAQDYTLGEEQAIGGIYQHEVQLKVNLVKIGSHWYITGETPLEKTH